MSKLYPVTLNHLSQGFIQRLGGPGISPPPNFPYPEILKLSMVIILAIYMLLNASMCHQNVRKFCPRLHQKQSKRYIDSNFSWGEMPPDPPSRHACVSHTTIILLLSCFPPTNSKSCMYPVSSRLVFNCMKPC